MPGMIELIEITKRFPLRPAFGRAPETVTALRDLSLEIPRGATWAFVGPNGAGKSTLFGVALGFLRPNEGIAKIEELPPRDWLKRNGAAYLPDRFRLPSTWPVRATLMGFARMERIGDPDAAVDRVLDRLGLAEQADRSVATLSRGMLQRLAIAQALLAPRELVVLDEPTQGLDPLWRIRFRELVRELHDRGATVLLASHDMNEVARMADKVVVLREGRVVELLDPAPAGSAQAWVLRLAAPCDDLMSAFPDATRVPGEDGHVWLVHAPDHAELSRRIAALLAGGAILAGLTPAGASLEHRVREALDS